MIAKFFLAATAMLTAAGPALAADAPTAAAVLKSYADIAEAKYVDSLKGAEALQVAVDTLLAKPDAATLALARDAWRAARPAYMQTEGYRFANTAADDLDGTANSWPLDEGLIDYVDAKSYGTESDSNPLYTANVIANKQIQIGPDKVDASTITPELLKKLQGADNVEGNVATGYHAIEFLLWGQNLHNTETGVGTRPASDFDSANCTHGDCERRADYLKVVTGMLVDDLKTAVAAWAEDGPARKELAGKGEDGGLSTILTGIGSLSYGELAGERMKLGLMLHDPEEAQDCFSNNTHNSHFYDEVGIVSIWNARYTRPSGAIVEGASLRDLVAAKDPAAAKRVDDAMADAMARMGVLKWTADSGEMAYDQMIAAGNDKGNKIVQDAIDGLVTQTRAIEGAVGALGLKVKVEGSESLDNPGSVTKK